MTWQTIDTAPKDGNWVILLQSNGAVSKGKFNQFRGLWVKMNYSKYDSTITHWMHLPDPPTGEE